MRSTPSATFTFSSPSHADAGSTERGSSVDVARMAELRTAEAGSRHVDWLKHKIHSCNGNVIADVKRRLESTKARAAECRAIIARYADTPPIDELTENATAIAMALVGATSTARPVSGPSARPP